jgi:hypothetical protein
MSALLGQFHQTQIDKSNWAIAGLTKAPRRNSKELEQKTAELRRLLQKNSIQTEGGEKSGAKSKLFSNYYKNKFSHTATMKSIDLTSSSKPKAKDVLFKLSSLFNNSKSADKTIRLQKKARDKRLASKSSEDHHKSTKHISTKKSREKSKQSKFSNESRPSSNGKKQGERVSSNEKSRSRVQRSESSKNSRVLQKFYDRLCGLVDSGGLDHDEKIKAISKMFIEYTKILDSQDAGRLSALSQEEQAIRSNLINFFAFYSRMNTKAYLYTRDIVNDSLLHLENFIVKEKDLLKQVVPRFFASQDQLDLDDAIQLVIEFSASLVEQNSLLNEYLKKNMRKEDIDEILLRKKKNKIVKSLVSGSGLNRRHSESGFLKENSSLSNLEKENDLNQIYNTSGQHQMKEDLGAHFDQQLERRATDQELGRTPNTNKLSHQRSVLDAADENDFEYSETSKKKRPGSAFGRKESKVVERDIDSVIGGIFSKEKKHIPPRAAREKNRAVDERKLDDRSFANINHDFVQKSSKEDANRRKQSHEAVEGRRKSKSNQKSSWLKPNG